ncbi:MAG TPA: SprT family zinc-dependent metalloprotease [Casimicrobiaceae bacterium]|nr:SprT family zinc-dependent metalloprotease [Casimicrobiaceae bacterium]
MSARLRLRDLFPGKRSDDPQPREGQLRRIVLAGRRVDYRLIRARRKSIGMEVGLSGLTVRAPRWVPVREIEVALSERDEWVVRSLIEWRARRRDVLPRAWKTGAPIVYLGRELRLAVHPARTREIFVDLLNLSVLHPAAHDERQVATFVGHWLRDEASLMLAPWVADLAAKITTNTPTFKLSNARSEWGSCNEHGVIRLNWRLVQLPSQLARYVVAHEVAHLVELNHSPRFWGLVEKLFPGHAEARATLDDWTALLEA